jgi:hypothetical protein
MSVGLIVLAVVIVVAFSARGVQELGRANGAPVTSMKPHSPGHLLSSRIEADLLE